MLIQLADGNRPGFQSVVSRPEYLSRRWMASPGTEDDGTRVASVGTRFLRIVGGLWFLRFRHCDILLPLTAESGARIATRIFLGGAWRFSGRVRQRENRGLVPHPKTSEVLYVWILQVN
jgi:hypothetical protein